MEVDAAIGTLFPKSLSQWQKFLYQVVIGIVILVTALAYVDTTNPLFTSTRELAVAILPWVYVAWILTGPVHGHSITMKTIVLAGAANLLANSVNFSSSPTWVQNGVTAVSDLSTGLLQGAIFGAVYTYGKSS